MPAPIRLASLAAAAVLALVACRGGAPDGEGAEADSVLPLDSLTESETAQFRPDPSRYPEMLEGRLDTVDMVGRSDDAAWHVQVMNYTPQSTAMTYAAWYVGPDSFVSFAADHQPRLVDDLGNVYQGIAVTENPRIRVESGSTAVGVFVFRGGVRSGADSLTLHVNDSTAPVIRVGPFGVRHEPREPGRMRVEPGSGN